MTRAYHKMASAIAMQSDLSTNAKSRERVGIISDYDPTTHAVKVMLQPENVEAPGWIPLGAVGVGNGFGVVTAPNIDDMVQVTFTRGDGNGARVTGRFFSTVNMPPIVPSGETWLFHSTGSFGKFTNDGKVTFKDKAGSTLVMGGDGTGVMSFAGGLTINANTLINGTLGVSKMITGQADILDNAATQSDTMAGMRGYYNSHTHKVVNVQTGGSTIVSNTPSALE